MSIRMRRLGELYSDYRRALDEIGRLAGGDPRRPDWDPLQSVELVRRRLCHDEPIVEAP